jgi:DEAD/DEAH box helicase domain-containing protein
MSIDDLLKSLKSSMSYENQIVHIEEILSRKPEHAPIELTPRINHALDQMGVKQLYIHQAKAIQNVRAGKDIVLVTSTASGKSLSYVIPIFETVMKDHKATALYIAPLNALINDQLNSFLEFRGELGIDTQISKYTGTMSYEEKEYV